MEINELYQAFDKKDWNKFLNYFENLNESNLSIDECLEIISFIKSINSDEAEKIFYQIPRLNYYLWNLCKRNGKISESEKYASQYILFLIKRKKIIQLNSFVLEIEKAGTLKKKIKNFKLLGSAMLGNKENYKIISKHFDLDDWHFEYWGGDQDSLKEKILINEELSKDDLQNLYKYILKYKFDDELILKLHGHKSLNQDQIKKIENLLKFKKVKVPMRKIEVDSSKTFASKIDYDQIAFDLISGKKELDINEQDRIITSLNLKTEEELNLKGYDMLVAFRLLEMNKVTLMLCEKLLSSIEEINKKASVLFVKVQTLIDEDECYKALDIIDDTISKLPLIKEELSAFWYLKYLAFKKLGKNENANQAFKQIRKIDSEFKLSKVKDSND